MAHDIAAATDRRADLTARDFRTSDAMILIAGAALALAAGPHLLVLLADMAGRLGKEAADHRSALLGNWPAFWAATHDSLRNVVFYGIQIGQMLLMGMTPAFLMIRMRRPRPAPRALLRQPGTAAGLAMVFGLFWGTGCLVWLFPDRIDSITVASLAVGGAVAMAWGALALGRWWSPEPGWVDRLGRVLAGLAIVTALLGLIVFRIWRGLLRPSHAPRVIYDRKITTRRLSAIS
jgi:hypothetical protein